jgi:indole-3-glycerol phosphate synthase
MKLPEGKPKRNGGLLDQILALVRSERPARQGNRATLEQRAGARPTPPDFTASLRRSTVSLIAEVKRRSPSVGDINVSLDPVALALEYQMGGASAISVLTENHHFGGSLEDLAVVANSVRLPVLRKDFILDELQLVEARAAGAAATLLIVRALDQANLKSLIQRATEMGMAALVEVHSVGELDRALSAGAEIIGVNARDLDTLEIDIDGALQLLATIPADKLAVAESGMRQHRDIRAAAAAGADAVLVGGALAVAPLPGALAAELAGVPRIGR